MEQIDDRGSDEDHNRSSLPQQRASASTGRATQRPSDQRTGAGGVGAYQQQSQYSQSNSTQIRRQFASQDNMAGIGTMVRPQEMDYHAQQHQHATGYALHGGSGHQQQQQQHHYPSHQGVQQSSSYGLPQHSQQGPPPAHYSHQQFPPPSQPGYPPQHSFPQQQPPPRHQQSHFQHQQQHMIIGDRTITGHSHQHQQQPPPPQAMAQGLSVQPYIQPIVGRLPANRPVVKLSLSLIETYKRINEVYYEEKQSKKAEKKTIAAVAKAQSHIHEQQQKDSQIDQTQQQQRGDGVNNNGYDDEHFDYILKSGETFNSRYIIQEKIGKGSFGQVVRAIDKKTNKDVAIKIIKSKRPFQLQAKTEIELLTHLRERDQDGSNNIVKLATHFIYRNHQCIVFEMLSLNLYDYLKFTEFGGVNLNLIRRFAQQILKALRFLARPDVDVIHCDLKPENILLRHPKRSEIKVIDFGSSCKSDKRMYSYIQSRFYRSPEVMLGLPYSVAIDMWSLGCILVEMHTGEPLFSGSDQFDQMQKIVKILGIVPDEMLNSSSDKIRLQFFEKKVTKYGTETWLLKKKRDQREICPSTDPIASLTSVICDESNKKKKYPSAETGQSSLSYKMFVDMIYKMLTYRPEVRIRPEEALQHPFIVACETPQTNRSTPSTNRSTPPTNKSSSNTFQS